MKKNAIDRLIEEVGELCRIYVGARAPSEPWIETCLRLEQISKTLQLARRQRILEARKEDNANEVQSGS